MPSSVAEWIAFAFVWGFIGCVGWLFVGFPLWFMIVEEPRERRARAEEAERERVWSYLTDDDKEWFAQHDYAVADPNDHWDTVWL